MYRTVGMAVIALAAITLPVGTSLAFGLGGGAGKFGASMANVAPAASHVPPKPGGGMATPQVKKLSGKAGRACFRACCTGCPARAGAISAIIPATAPDQSRRYVCGG
jgi:hypothetical protein